jgi:hypothetical protein
MGKQPGPGQAKASLLAFHAAMLRVRREAGQAPEPISVKDWEAAMCRVLTEQGSILTRQSCADKTWFLERLGLITKTKDGILLQPAPQATEPTMAVPA